MLHNANQESFRNLLIQLQNSDTSIIFKQAFREDSNREDIWLWYASQAEAPLEKRYCLQRALYINPQNREVRHQLGILIRATTAIKTQKQSFIARVFVTLFSNGQ